MTSEEAAADPGHDGAPKKKKKKRKAKKPGEAAPARGAVAPSIEAPERAAFLADFPSHPELDALVAAFEEGNYALVREKAPRLAGSTDDEDVRRAARELRRRIDPDPLVVYLLLTALALLAFLALWYWTHRHAP